MEESDLPVAINEEGSNLTVFAFKILEFLAFLIYRFFNLHLGFLTFYNEVAK